MTQIRHAEQAFEPYRCTVGVLHLDLLLHGCRSLKEKRGRLARIMGHLTKKHKVVLAEVGAHDSWERTGLAAVTISPDRDLAGQILEAAARTVAQDHDVELVWHEIELI